MQKLKKLIIACDGESACGKSTAAKLISKKYNLKLCHNPEFLTARTAYEDFHNQTHIVLGLSLIHI